MANELPEQFDLVVIGTGFTESCIAAAASRIGKTVLHLDVNEYYGDIWSSFNLEALNNLLQSGGTSVLQNTKYIWHNNEHSTCDAILSKSRRFNIDLCPRILYAAGELVQLLIKSNICRYAEFRALDNVCIYDKEIQEIVGVPCSRSDVFNSTSLSIVEKRLLMKFLMTCNDYGDDKYLEDSVEFRGKTFYEYLQAQRVTKKIATCVMEAIALCNTSTSFEDGMKRTQRFLQSLGRYGNTPFLFPMYGCGELPQCFCRLCAVYGGIYCLKRNVSEINVAADTNELLICSNESTIRAKHVICAPGQLPEKIATQFGELHPHISRAVFISDQPVGSEELNKGGGGVNLLRLSDGENRDAIFIQLSHYSGTCPEGYYVFHLTTPARSNDPAHDLSTFVSQIFKNDTSHILYSAYFTMMAYPSSTPMSANLPIYCTSAPNYEMDYDAAIANARDIFKGIYGDEEFLPRAPDPEEIVVDGEDPSALNEHSLPEDLRAHLHDIEDLTNQMDIQ